MEQERIAHYDLSGPNLIIEPGLVNNNKNTIGIQLIDLEDIYSPVLLHPEKKPGGSAGYAHNSSKSGIWDSNADRFAGAILLSEILGWSDPKIRDNAFGEQYFDIDELQTSCFRYELLVDSLNLNWGISFGELFKQSWNSTSLLDCPPFSNWDSTLNTRTPEITLRKNEFGNTPTESTPVIGWRNLSGETTPLSSEINPIESPVFQEKENNVGVNNIDKIQNNPLSNSIKINYEELLETDWDNMQFGESSAPIIKEDESRNHLLLDKINKNTLDQKNNKSVSLASPMALFLIIIGFFMFIGFLSNNSTQKSNMKATQTSKMQVTETVKAIIMQTTQTAQIEQTLVFVSQLENSKKYVTGRESGNLYHDEDDYVETFYGMGDIKNFILEVNFHNPYDGVEFNWDFGVLFRQIGGNDQFRLIVTSGQDWEFIDWYPSEISIIQSGDIFNLNLENETINNIKLYVYENDGYFFINDKFISQLKLNSRTSYGGISIGTGFNGSEIDGEITRFTDFSIWKIADTGGSNTGGSKTVVSSTVVSITENSDSCMINIPIIDLNDHYLKRRSSSYYDYEAYYENDDGWKNYEYKMHLDISPHSPTTRCSPDRLIESNCSVLENYPNLLKCNLGIYVNFGQNSDYRVSEAFCHFDVKLTNGDCGNLYKYSYKPAIKKH